MNLTQHFTVAEMTASQTAARKGIDNSLPPKLLPPLTALCRHVLEPVRAQFGPVRVSSGYRCPKLNAAIGSKPGSQHVLAEAADFTVPGVTNIAVAQWIAANLKFDQLILEFGPTGWVHCSWREGRLRGEVLTIDGRGTRPGLFTGS